MMSYFKDKFKKSDIIVIFFISLIIIISRRPDAIFNPQFWAEDGAVWYAQAYHYGPLKALFFPHNGYLQSISRITAAFAQILPLRAAPLTYNVIAIFFQFFPVIFFCSSRFDFLVPRKTVRFLLILIYLILPYSHELHVNITNTHTRLALLAFMVLIATPNKKLLWRFFDIGVILLSGLSGPFCIVLAPIAFIKWFLRRNHYTRTILFLLIITALIQGLCVLLYRRPSELLPLGATLNRFSAIVAYIYTAAITGSHGVELLAYKDSNNLLIIYAIVATGSFFVFFVFIKASLELRLFIIFSNLIFLSSLFSPNTSAILPQWEAFLIPGVNTRYYFFPIFSFLICLGWGWFNSTRWHNLLVVYPAICILFFAGAFNNWVFPPLDDYHYQKSIQKLDKAGHGEPIAIPTPPSWQMVLYKKAVTNKRQPALKNSNASVLSKKTKNIPPTGLWFNFSHYGHFLITHKDGQGIKLIWLTYNEIGEPRWFTAYFPIKLKTSETILFRHVKNDRNEIQKIPSGKISFESESGELNSAMHSCKIYWEKNGEKGYEVFSPFVLADYMEENHSGFWAFERLKGYGLSIIQKGQNEWASLLFYDRDGNPLWAVGHQINVVSKKGINMFLIEGYKSNGAYKPIRYRKIGRIVHDFYSLNKGSLDVEFNYPTFYNDPKLLINDRILRTTDIESGISLFNQAMEKCLLLNKDNGYKGLDVLNQIRLLSTKGGLILRSLGDDPQISLPILVSPPKKQLLIKVVISAPCETILQLYYRTESSPQYNERQSLRKALKKGYNEIFFQILSSEITGSMRLDPGQNKGDFLLHSVEGKYIQ